MKLEVGKKYALNKDCPALDSSGNNVTLEKGTIMEAFSVSGREEKPAEALFNMKVATARDEEGNEMFIDETMVIEVSEDGKRTKDGRDLKDALDDLAPENETVLFENDDFQISVDEKDMDSGIANEFLKLLGMPVDGGEEKSIKFSFGEDYILKEDLVGESSDNEEVALEKGTIVTIVEFPDDETEGIARGITSMFKAGDVAYATDEHGNGLIINSWMVEPTETKGAVA